MFAFSRLHFLSFLCLLTGLPAHANPCGPHMVEAKKLNEIKSALPAFNMDVYLEKVRNLSHNPVILPLLRYLKKKGNGKMKREYASAIAALEIKPPFSIQGWAGLYSLETHFDKHALDMRLLTQKNYERASMELALRQGNTLMIFNPVKQHWIKFDPETSEFLILNRVGGILSFYQRKSSRELNFEYFLFQQFNSKFH